MLVFNEIKTINSCIILLTAASIVDLCTYTNNASIRFASDVANHPGFVFTVITAIKNVLFKGFVFCCYPSK